MGEEIRIIIDADVKRFMSAIDDVRKELKETSDDAKTSGEDMSNGFNKAGTTGKKVASILAKAFAAAISAAVTAVSALVKASVEAYAQYEQLIGGVETLFGESSKIVEGYANEAYKTAGLSANAYMETITGFSASLLQSLGGDTVAAAEYGNMAIIDMADNANKMGTSMQDIQNAYQGFAKQNYTMLDNLKLGYGGTKAEMERLIADANRVKAANGEMANLSIDSFADVTEAIHIMQGELGITGTTAKEASETISGSCAMTKAAWQNLLVGMASDNANFDQLINNFVESASTAFENILPRVITALNGVVDLIEGVLPPVIAKLPQIINDVLPNLLSAGINIIVALIEGITQSLPALTNAVVVAIPQLITGILSVLPALIDAGIQMIVALINGISQMLPEVLVAIVEIIPQIVTAITSNIGLIIEAGITLLMALIQAIPIVIQALVPEIGNIVSMVVSTLIANMPILIEGAIILFMAILQAIPVIVVEIVKLVPTIIKAIVEGLINGAKQVLGAAGELFNGIITKAGEAKDKVVERIKSLGQGMKESFNNMKENTKEAWENIKNTMSEKISTAKTKVSEKLSGIRDDMKAKLSGALTNASSILSKISDTFKNKMDTARERVKSAIDKIKGFFKFQWKLPDLKLPHISIVGEFNLMPPRVPKFSISWYARGGVFDNPTLFPMGGLGEAGAEAIVPLEKNTQWLDRLANMLNDRLGTNTPIVLQVDGKTFAQTSIKSINDLTRQQGKLGLTIL